MLQDKILQEKLIIQNLIKWVAVELSRKGGA